LYTPHSAADDAVRVKMESDAALKLAANELQKAKMDAAVAAQLAAELADKARKDALAASNEMQAAKMDAERLRVALKISEDARKAAEKAKFDAVAGTVAL
jgi:hypothetical protein